MGLAGTKASWQRQTRYFGHDNGDKYSVLIIDNRGIGESDKPIGRYTTKGMAQDIIEVVDHVGWTDERQLNIVGISLGGMIAQEIGCLIPMRLQSLSLLCTTSSFESNKSPLESFKSSLGMVIPKSEEETIRDTASKIFIEEWLHAPDAENLPSPKTTPKCGPAPGPTGEYAKFENNFQRFAAQELTKRHTPGHFTVGGFLCQLAAAAGHRKSAAQLHDMAEKVGRKRILVLHGTRDNMIHVVNGQKLIKLIDPGVGLIVEDLGHAPVMERTQWFNSLLEERLNNWTRET